jgi:alpha-galactosidase/6-phospho-beta-glucosidase family protein
MPIRKRPLKIVCVGGGSYRLLPILRGVFAVRPVLDGGEVRLVDRVLPRAHLEKPLDDAFWAASGPKNRCFGRDDRDLSIPLLKALAGLGAEKIVASAPNRGAVAGFDDRAVLEYSQLVDRDGARPLGVPLAVPAPFHGLITSLSSFQTLLGDAIAAQDPRTLADALFVYPVQFNTRNARRLACELRDIHRTEIPAWCQETKRWLAGPLMGKPGK